MTGNRHTCARVRRHASNFLDGRLRADARAAVQRHLRTCPGCMRTLREFSRLSRATHNLPPHRARPELADGVRAGLAARGARKLETLSDAGRRPVGRWLRAAAAAALLLGAWALGYDMAPGGASQSGLLSAQQSAPEPAPTPRLTQRTAPASTFCAASRQVLRDLTWADAMPAHAREPMIATQFAMFDLRRRAEQILERPRDDAAERDLAHFVVGLAAALDSDEAIDWRHWQDRAAQDASLQSAQPQIEPRRPASPDTAIELAVDRYGRDLTPPERHDLRDFLELKWNLVAGHPRDGIAVVQRWQHRTSNGTTSFGIATGMTGVSAFAQAGMDQDAARLEQVMRDMMRQMGVAPPTSGSFDR